MNPSEREVSVTQKTRAALKLDPAKMKSINRKESSALKSLQDRAIRDRERAAMIRALSDN